MTRDQARAQCEAAGKVTREAALAAVEALHAERESLYYRGVSASEVAWWVGIDGVRRHGNGAVKGSWSGFMSESLRAAPVLRSLAAKGELEAADDGRRARYTPAGTHWWDKPRGGSC